MSQRRALPPKTPAPPPAEEEEDEFDEDEEEDFEDGPDMLEALASLLATEDGETIATLLAGSKEATEKIALQLEMQNKILVKILTELKNSKISTSVAPEEVQP
jgi:hypothetical protein